MIRRAASRARSFANPSSSAQRSNRGRASCNSRVESLPTASKLESMIYSLSPCAIGARYGYILSPLV
eukprot:4403438-Pyramimonas_sp.AAC.1